MLKRGYHGYEGKKEENREKKGEKRERGRKRVRQGGAKVRGEFFILLQAFQVSSKWNQGREAKENPRNKLVYNGGKVGFLCFSCLMP